MTTRLPKHLHDAVTAARRAEDFLGGLDANGYTSNVLVRSAVERQLEILGEACRRALDDRVLATVVVDTVRRDVPRLRQLLQVELARFPVD